jgi:glyoxylase-like metal-dependent hydrolase (beta-lactamase superfamily II)
LRLCNLDPALQGYFNHDRFSECFEIYNALGDYLDSLARLRSFNLKALYPGHGRVSTTPIEDIDRAMVNARMLLETKNHETVDIFYQNAHENPEANERETNTT